LSCKVCLFLLFIFRRHSRLGCDRFTTSHSYLFVWVFGIIDVCFQSASNSRRSPAAYGEERRMVTDFYLLLLTWVDVNAYQETPDLPSSVQLCWALPINSCIVEDTLFQHFIASSFIGRCFSCRCYSKLMEMICLKTRVRSVSFEVIMAVTMKTPSSGMLCRVAIVRTDVSGERVTFIIKVTKIGELGTTVVVTSNRSTLQRNTKYFYYVLCTMIYVLLRSVLRLLVIANVVLAHRFFSP
jgi:hypothetical protein